MSKRNSISNVVSAVAAKGYITMKSMTNAIATLITTNNDTNEIQSYNIINIEKKDMNRVAQTWLSDTDNDTIPSIPSTPCDTLDTANISQSIDRTYRYIPSRDRAERIINDHANDDDPSNDDGQTLDIDQNDDDNTQFIGINKSNDDHTNDDDPSNDADQTYNIDQKVDDNQSNDNLQFNIDDTPIIGKRESPARSSTTTSRQKPSRRKPYRHVVKMLPYEQLAKHKKFDDGTVIFDMPKDRDPWSFLCDFTHTMDVLSGKEKCESYVIEEDVNHPTLDMNHPIFEETSPTTMINDNRNTSNTFSNINTRNDEQTLFNPPNIISTIPDDATHQTGNEKIQRICSDMSIDSIDDVSPNDKISRTKTDMSTDDNQRPTSTTMPTNPSMRDDNYIIHVTSNVNINFDMEINEFSTTIQVVDRFSEYFQSRNEFTVTYKGRVLDIHDNLHERGVLPDCTVSVSVDNVNTTTSDMSQSDDQSTNAPTSIPSRNDSKSSIDGRTSNDPKDTVDSVEPDGSDDDASESDSQPNITDDDDNEYTNMTLDELIDHNKRLEEEYKRMREKRAIEEKQMAADREKLRRRKEIFEKAMAKLEQLKTIYAAQRKEIGKRGGKIPVDNNNIDPDNNAHSSIDSSHNNKKKIAGTQSRSRPRSKTLPPRSPPPISMTSNLKRKSLPKNQRKSLSIPARAPAGHRSRRRSSLDDITTTDTREREQRIAIVRQRATSNILNKKGVPEKRMSEGNDNSAVVRRIMEEKTDVSDLNKLKTNMKRNIVKMGRINNPSVVPMQHTITGTIPNLANIPQSDLDDIDDQTTVYAPFTRKEKQSIFDPIPYEIKWTKSKGNHVIKSEGNINIATALEMRKKPKRKRKRNRRRRPNHGPVVDSRRRTRRERVHQMMIEPESNASMDTTTTKFINIMDAFTEYFDHTVITELNTGSRISHQFMSHSGATGQTAGEVLKVLDIEYRAIPAKGVTSDSDAIAIQLIDDGIIRGVQGAVVRVYPSTLNLHSRTHTATKGTVLLRVEMPDDEDDHDDSIVYIYANLFVKCSGK